MKALTDYEAAWLVGGAERVAQVVFVALAQEGNLEVAYKRQRVKVARNEPTNPVDAAALGMVPDSGLSVSEFITRLAAHPAVRDLESTLRRKRVRRRHWFLWPTRTYRGLVKDPGRGLRRVAVLGTPGIEDERLRHIFEQPVPGMPEFDKHDPRTFNTIDGTIGPNSTAVHGASQVLP